MRRQASQQSLPIEKRPPDARSLLTETTIRSVVYSFYIKVKEDDLLASVFEPRLDGHWDEHLDTMVDFWSSVLLSTGRYHGRPLTIHSEIGEVTPEMWARWLQLFGEASREHASEPVAALLSQRAEQIAGHLSRSVEIIRAAQAQET